jgi:hypothetical protein
MNSYPKPYPPRIEKEIIAQLLALKEATEQEYPRELYEPRRAAFLQDVTTKKVGAAGTAPTRT